ncbi:MAG: hypothetical protein QXP52_00240 [Candidatus Aenigmatarchaeota archaeon]
MSCLDCKNLQVNEYKAYYCKKYETFIYNLIPCENIESKKFGEIKNGKSLY